jgi:hypothetical protein
MVPANGRTGGDWSEKARRPPDFTGTRPATVTEWIPP